MKFHRLVSVSSLIGIITFTLVTPVSGSSAQNTLPVDPEKQPIAAATFDCSAVTEIPQIECQALVALYNNTNGSGWVDNGGWLANNHPCTGPAWAGLWEGCSEARLHGFGHISQIWLYENNLRGSIPPEIGNFSDLQVLFLQSNQLVGALPTQLGNLSSLDTVWINANPLSGPLPRSLMNVALYEFNYESTSLCEPDDVRFQNWLAGIHNLGRTGVICLSTFLPMLLRESG